ncbi:MAG TPA: acyltransferase [Drouetiella sp.]
MDSSNTLTPEKIAAPNSDEPNSSAAISVDVTKEFRAAVNDEATTDSRAAVNDEATTDSRVTHADARTSVAASTRPKSNDRVAALDGVRALAILSVLTFHSGGPLGAIVCKRGGWLGVDIFFVLSGFLITGILLKERARTNTISLKHFYLRRALRLTPVYVLFIAITILTSAHYCQNIWAAIGVAALYMVDYDVALSWGNIAGSGLEIAWSLAVEEKFYLVWPTLMKTFRNNLPQVTAAIICGAWLWKLFLNFQTSGPLAYSHYLGVGAAFDTKMDEIMLGCLASISLSNDKIRSFFKKTLGREWVSIALLIVLFLFMRGMTVPGSVHNLEQRLMLWNVKLPLFCLGVTALLVSLAVKPNSLVAKFLGLAPMAWVGRISYSLYLWHGLAFAVTTLYVFRNTMTISMSFMEVCNYAMAIAFAACSYYLVEMPFLRLKEKLGH